MTENDTRKKRFLPPLLSLPALSMLIASLSLASSISQSYNYRRNIETVQQNVLRAENLKTCREIIDVFFGFRLKAEDAQMRRSADSTRELKAFVYRFGALGTYLANFTPETARERYTALTWKLNEIAEKAGTWPPAEFDAKFAEADRVFGTLNEDCARLAQFVKI